MKFSIGDDRAEFGAAVRAALEKGCTPTDVRAAWDRDTPLDRSVWTTLVDMGANDPDLDWVTRCVVGFEVGRAALPHPWVETAFVAAPMIGDKLEGRIATSDLGTVPNIPAGADADVFVTRTGQDSFIAVWAGGADFTPIDAADGSRRLVRADGLVNGKAITPKVDVELAGALGTAAVLLGLGRHVLDTTVAYVSEREQFGQPVGGFQAVKHHLADVLKDLSFAWPIVLRAAYGLDTGAATAERDCSMAKALASDAASLAADTCLQCHGAIAYTVEYDLHLWLKRIWALSRAWGDADHHRDLVGRALGV